MPKSRHHFALTPAYIEWIHDTLLAPEWPGVGPSMSAAYRNKALLESAAARPFQTAFGRYIHRGVARRAAALFHSLIANHPFGDGNKRTAVSALHHFLLANGLLLLAGQEEMYNLALETAFSGESGMKQNELLGKTTRVLKVKTVPVSELRGVNASLYRRVRGLKRHIRTNPLNCAKHEAHCIKQAALLFNA